MFDLYFMFLVFHPKFILSHLWVIARVIWSQRKPAANKSKRRNHGHFYVGPYGYMSSTQMKTQKPWTLLRGPLLLHVFHTNENAETMDASRSHSGNTQMTTRKPWTHLGHRAATHKYKPRKTPLGQKVASHL